MGDLNDLPIKGCKYPNTKKLIREITCKLHRNPKGYKKAGDIGILTDSKTNEAIARSCLRTKATIVAVIASEGMRLVSNSTAA